MNNSNIILSVKNISKKFEATLAVNNASLELQRGEIHGLVGENGSGKTTLVSIISGVVKNDSGYMEKDGKGYRPVDIIDASKNGINIVFQEMSTIDGLSIAQNIFFGLEKSFSRLGFLNPGLMNTEAKKLLDKYGLKNIDPSLDISALTFEERKLTEFAKALYTNPDILIVDETTTALSQDGRKLLFSIIHNFRKEGKSIIFITHELHEIFEHCNTVTVMRDGEIIGTDHVKKLDENKIKSMMVGRKFIEGGEYYRTDLNYSNDKAEVLKVENLSRKGVFHEVNFELKKGEILGIGGLTNCGMHELGKVLFGIEKADSGKITLLKNNEEIEINNTTAAINNKIAYVSKNRDQESIMLTSNIMDNIALPGLDLITKATFISPAKKRKYALDNTRQLSVKMRNIDQLVMYLSGGNKQKVAVSKWLANGSEIFILDCPTRGIDVAVKAAIYKIMRDFESKGYSLIMISEELPELIGMSDRIIIMKKGRISSTINRGKNFKEEYLLNFMI